MTASIGFRHAHQAPDSPKENHIEGFARCAMAFSISLAVAAGAIAQAVLSLSSNPFVIMLVVYVPILMGLSG